jgi:dihydropteroate synthase
MEFLAPLTGRPPRARLPGTLAALGHGVRQGAHIFRVHDLAAAADFLAVYRALEGEQPPSEDLVLAEDLRHEPAAAASPRAQVGQADRTEAGRPSR